MVHNAAKHMALETAQTPNQLRIRFPYGIIGFEDFLHYQLHPLHPEKPYSIFWQLSCQDAEGLSFILFFHDNQLGNEFVIQEEHLQEALFPNELPREELAIFLIVSTENEDGKNLITVNLRAPIVMHLPSKQAWQVILTDASYPISLPLV